MPIWSVDECGEFIYNMIKSRPRRTEEIYVLYGHEVALRNLTEEEIVEERSNFFYSFSASRARDRMAFDPKLGYTISH